MEAHCDYYATLNVSPDADAAALRRAYRALMRRYHPDVNKDADAGAQCHAINEAYDCLRDRARRAHYDAMRRVAKHGTWVHAAERPMWAQHHGGGASSATVFTPRYAARFDEESVIQTRWRKAVVIALGVLATLATFTATARVDWTPTPAMDVGASTRDIVMKAGGDRARPAQN